MAKNLPDVGYDAKFFWLFAEWKKRSDVTVLPLLQMERDKSDRLVWMGCEICSNTHLQHPPPLHAPLLDVWQSSMLDKTGCRPSWQ